MAIAEHGYLAPLNTFNYDIRPAFFPVFPALTAALMPIVRVPISAALITSNACLLAALAILWRLTAMDWGEGAARRVVWIYLVFPGSLFLSAPYTESVMLAATVGAVLAARQRRWLVSGLLASAATLARPVGFIALTAPLLEAPLSLPVL